MAIGLLFSGQGAQKVGMGKSLAEGSPVARELYERADATLGWSLSGICFEGHEAELTETRVCQPALYVMGYAVYALLRESGQLADLRTCLGLSLGELTALAAAEAFDFETGLKIVAERGRLMQEACDRTEGTMASFIGGSPEDVAELAREFDVDVANLNCPGQIVISGDRNRVLEAVAAAKDRGTFKMVVPLTVAGAYHSRLMESARVQFETYLEGVEIAKPKFTVFTNVTGAPVESPDAIRASLVKQVVSAVRWEDCMRSAAALGVTEFFECGPGAVLAGLARRIDRGLKVTSIAEYAQVPGV